MSLFILDTDTFSLLLDGHPTVTEQVLRSPRDTLAVTIVTVDESLTGWYTQIRRARNDEAVIRAYGALQRVVKELALVPILSFDATAADVARKLRLKDRRMGTNDLRIAAIAVSNSATLITRNLKDFSRLADLTVEDWSVRSPLSE